MELCKKRRFRRCTALVCALVIVLSSLTAAAADTVETLESQTSALENELNGINREIYNLSEDIAAAEIQLETLGGEIERTRNALIESEAKEVEQYQNMKARIKYMYENGNASFLEMLFSAQDMADFLNKADFLEALSEYDQNAIEDLQQTKLQIQEESASLELQKTTLKEMEKDLSEKKNALQKQAKATSADLDKVRAKLAKAQEEKAKQEAEQNANKADGENSGKGDANKVSSGSVNNNKGTINKGGYSASSNELTLMAALLDCEAKPNYDAMMAVATVIMNRVESSRFPNSITGVIYAKGQFSPVWSGRLDARLKRGPSSIAKKVAQDAINGKRLSSVSHCYFFLYAPYTSRKGIVIGDNLFFARW